MVLCTCLILFTALELKLCISYFDLQYFKVISSCKPGGGGGGGGCGVGGQMHMIDFIV